MNKEELKSVLISKGYTVGYSVDSRDNPFDCVQTIYKNHLLGVALDLVTLNGSLIEQVIKFIETEFSAHKYKIDKEANGYT